MSLLERGKIFHRKSKEIVDTAPTFDRMVVMGATGKIARLWLDRGTKTNPRVSLTGIVRHFDKRLDPFPTVGFTDDIGTILREQKPDALVVATANQDNDTVLQSIRDNITDQTSPLTLILVQNGLEVSEKAKQLFAGTNVTLVRVLIFTPVSENEDGTIKYNEKKLRAGIAVIPGEPGNTTEETASLQKTEAFLRQGGFKVIVEKEDYKKLELAKAELNAIGTTGDVTQLTPRETFSDRRLRGLEYDGISQRRKAIKANGIVPTEIRWGGASRLPLLEHRSVRIAANHRPIAPFVTRLIVKGRDNKPPSTAERIKAGAPINQTEARPYHQPFIDMAQQAGTQATVDKAILNTLKRHQADVDLDGINLNGMRPKDRKRILLEAAGQKGSLVERAAVKILGSDWFAKVSMEFLLRTIRIKVINPENLERMKAILERPGENNSFVMVATDTDSLVIAAYGKAIKKTFRLDKRFTAFVADKHANKKRNPIQGAILNAWARVIGADIKPMVQVIDHYHSNQVTAQMNYDAITKTGRQLRAGGSIATIIPTGTRSKSGKLEGEAHRGAETLFKTAGDNLWAISIAAHHGRRIPILHMRILPFLTRTTITVGEPYNCRAIVEESRKTGVPIAKLVTDNLSALLPERERGVITIPAPKPRKTA